MFDSRKEIGERTLDAVDLIIDFATLGEYGLEPVDAAPRPCETRRRIGSPRRSTGAWMSAIDHFAAQS
jgi:hypothetical protein